MFHLQKSGEQFIYIYIYIYIYISGVGSGFRGLASLLAYFYILPCLKVETQMLSARQPACSFPDISFFYGIENQMPNGFTSPLVQGHTWGAFNQPT
jgi:hypothetical protein